jgi:hypothetical protein
MTHMICDGHGNQLADGMGPVHALWRATELATTLGTAVYVYGPGDTDETATAVQPDPAMALRLRVCIDCGSDLHTVDDPSCPAQHDTDD